MNPPRRSWAVVLFRAADAKLTRAFYSPAAAAAALNELRGRYPDKQLTIVMTVSRADDARAAA